MIPKKDDAEEEWSFSSTITERMARFGLEGQSSAEASKADSEKDRHVKPPLAFPSSSFKGRGGLIPGWACTLPQRDLPCNRHMCVHGHMHAYTSIRVE